MAAAARAAHIDADHGRVANLVQRYPGPIVAVRGILTLFRSIECKPSMARGSNMIFLSYGAPIHTSPAKPIGAVAMDGLSGAT